MTAGAQPVRRQRHLHRDIPGDAAQHAGLGQHAVVVGGGDLGADRAGDRSRRSRRSRPGCLRPDLAISDGLVVTPSSRPEAASDLISAVSAVSTKNFMRSHLVVPPRLDIRRVCERIIDHGRCRQKANLAPSCGHAGVSVSRPVRLPRAGGADGATGRRGAGAAEPARGGRRRLGPPGQVPGGRPLGHEPGAGSVPGGVPDGDSYGHNGGGVPERKLKPLIAVLDTPPMRAELRRFVDWMASYTLSPPGEVMAMALRVVSPDTGRAAAGWRPADPMPELGPIEPDAPSAPTSKPRLTAARQRVLAALADGLPRAAAELAARGRRRRRRGAGDGRTPACWSRRRCRRTRRSRRPTRTIPGPGAVRGAGRGRRGAARGGGGARILGDAARRRHRLRQDRGVFRGGGGMPARRAPGAGAAAGDRAVVAVAGAVRAPLRRRAGGLALRPRARARGGSPGGRWPRAARRWWSARARRCSCRSPISAWSWSTRSTRPRSSRRTAWSTTPATWRWCARGCARRRRCWSPPRPAWRRWPTSRPAATGGITLARRHGGATLPAVAAIDMRETPPERGRFLAPPLIEAMRRDAGARRAGDAVPQPPRLRAADAVPALRAPDGLPELHRLAGGAPRAQLAAMPPLRPRRSRSRPSARPAARRTA